MNPKNRIEKFVTINENTIVTNFKKSYDNTIENEYIVEKIDRNKNSGNPFQLSKSINLQLKPDQKNIEEKEKSK
jgi:hypothetical protein